MRVLIVELKSSRLVIATILLTLSASITLAQNVEEKLKEETTKYDQANSEFMLIEAEKFFLLEDYERAIAFLNKALEVDDKNHAAYFKKAEIYLLQNDTKKGLEAIKSAINLVKDNKYYYVLGAQLEMADRNTEGATSFYQLMVDNTTDFQAYLIELANTYQAIGAAKRAIDIFEQENSLTLNQSMKLVEMYMQESKEKNALGLMEKLIVDYPSDMDLKYQNANLLSKAGQEDKAIAALEAEPNKTTEMSLLLSDLYAGNGQAKAKYQLLIESFGDPEATLTDKTLLLGQLLIQTKEDIPINLVDSLQSNLEYLYPDEALAIENGTYVYTKLAEIASGDQKALYQLKAMNRYKQLKDLKPGDFKVWDKVLSYEYEAGDWQTLSADAEEALEIYPNQAIFYIYLASAKIKLDEPDEAKDLLNQATRMTRSNALLQSQILGKQAEIALLENNINTAGKLFDQALKLEVIHPETALSYGLFTESYTYEASAEPEKVKEIEKDEETDVSEKSKAKAKPKELNNIYTQAARLYLQGDYNRAFLLLLQNIHTFEDNRDGAAVELYGDILYQLKVDEAAMKYWKKAKEFGGASEKIDQKIASGKIN